MTPEAQRIAIAEACGWEPREPDNLYSEKRWINPHDKTRWRGDYARKVTGLPDYLNDLNAMHKVEKVLKGEQRNKYWELLCLTVPLSGDNSTNAWAATAAQRAEAFLRTIGKWEDDK